MRMCKLERDGRERGGGGRGFYCACADAQCQQLCLRMLCMARAALGMGVLGPPCRGVASLATKMAEYRRMRKPTEPQGWAEQYQERFIPFSKGQLVSTLLKEFHSTDADRASFLSFVARVDSSLLHHYHSVMGHLQVTVNLDQYEYIRFWALGQRIGPLPVKSTLRPQQGFFGTAPLMPRRYFKRMVVAARPKNAHLVLKCFKDIPLEALEHLLPLVKIRTSIFYRALLNAMLLVSGLALFVNVGMVVLSDLKVGTTFLLLCFAAFMSFRAWKVFGRRRNVHSLELVHMLYYRSTSNNSELLGALALRALEEHAKELILADSFLRRQSGLPQHRPIDAQTVARLQEQIQAWLHLHSGLHISFCAERACQHLQSFEGASPRPMGVPSLTPL
ncbi:transmembrane protein 143 isoform X5 [Alligator sinensis]|uniref:Transmembrane protein 143 isoform X5 n=1 Tax=Alligator sinensis TaxID=38654 RepID=A0A3Q0G3U8_ALLSI|nr:transmembrane protein 143 isoform X5 [Alligator sinensis]